MKQLLLTLLLLASSALQASDLQISDVWVREAPPGAPVLAGYLRIDNSGNKPRHLRWASSPKFADTMLHQSIIADGTARMAHVEQLTIPAGGSVLLEPGGYHLMLMQPQAPLRAGDSVPLLLCFDRDEHIELMAPVRRLQP